MKEYDLEMTQENLKCSIENDTLDRNRKLNKLIELLNGIKGNKIISIDATIVKQPIIYNLCNLK